MNQTEKYLNGILSKRLGSVINESASSKQAGTVARIPLSQEPLQKMPTVFRKHYETVLVQQESMIRDTRLRDMAQSQASNMDKQPLESHRVEYMAISKRITLKKNDDLISPTVDIQKYETKYKKKNTLSPQPLETMQVIPGLVNRKSEGSMGDISSAPRMRRKKIFS